jgi:trans-aconitate methyltransferase
MSSAVTVNGPPADREYWRSVAGEGLLADQLTPERFEQFVGVDIAAPAVERALARSLPNSCFITADATEFAPSMSFDVIVFNKALEYFTDPVRLVQRYEKWLVAANS